MTDSIHIIYFSGTGGTALAAKTLAASIAGAKAGVSEIFRDDNPKIEQGEMLVLMYPVYAADAPVPVFKWIDSLEKREGSKAAVISVSGGGEISPNTACRVKAIRRLERKGFIVTGEYMLCMPSNFIAPTDDDLAASLINILPKKCKAIADEIAVEKTNRKKPLLIDRIMLIFFALEKFGAKFFEKLLKADGSCNGCGLCAAKCPRANIKMDKGRPKFGWKCAICMRCIYSCPQKSIYARLPILKKAVFAQGFDLDSIIKRAQKAPQGQSITKDQGYLFKGVEEYIIQDSV